MPNLAGLCLTYLAIQAVKEQQNRILIKVLQAKCVPLKPVEKEVRVGGREHLCE